MDISGKRDSKYPDDDSQIVIKWISGISRIRNLQLIPLFEETRRLKERLESVSSKHVYMEINMMADEMAKAGVNMAEGSWHITEIQNTIKSEYFHDPF